jgi:hypothetical protein
MKNRLMLGAPNSLPCSQVQGEDENRKEIHSLEKKEEMETTSWKIGTS